MKVAATMIGAWLLVSTQLVAAKENDAVASIVRKDFVAIIKGRIMEDRKHNSDWVDGALRALVFIITPSIVIAFGLAGILWLFGIAFGLIPNYWILYLASLIVLLIVIIILRESGIVD